jgi:ribonuclease G
LIEKRVWLKSGANIIIEQLETMTVIDINSGKNISKNETAILEINKEAAVEIARQLRLRNISGMIIIDFINMKSKDYMEELIAVLKEQIKQDTVTCTFMDVTKLGLVELTRKKTYKSLKEIIS